MIVSTGSSSGPGAKQCSQLAIKTSRRNAIHILKSYNGLMEPAVCGRPLQSASGWPRKPWSLRPAIAAACQPAQTAASAPPDTASPTKPYAAPSSLPSVPPVPQQPAPLAAWVPPEGRPGLYDSQGRLVLKSLTLQELEAWCAAEGELHPANRALQLWRWMYADPPAGRWIRGLEETVGRQNGFSTRFIEKVGSQITLDGGLQLTRVVRAGDGTRKLVFQVTCGEAAGGSVEAVLIPIVRQQGLRDRLTLCVSSQVGCAMNCQFCYTGRMGLLGNLTTAQIVEQVVEARRFLEREGDRTQLTNLVFMGMGEPLHNPGAVVAAADIVSHYLGLHISHNKITISTVGLVPEMRRVVARTRVQLALSLHATTDEVRDWIVPVNRRYDLATLTAALEELFPKDPGAPPAPPPSRPAAPPAPPSAGPSPSSAASPSPSPSVQSIASSQLRPQSGPLHGGREGQRQDGQQEREDSAAASGGGRWLPPAVDDPGPHLPEPASSPRPCCSATTSPPSHPGASSNGRSGRSSECSSSGSGDGSPSSMDVSASAGGSGFYARHESATSSNGSSTVFSGSAARAKSADNCASTNSTDSGVASTSSGASNSSSSSSSGGGAGGRSLLVEYTMLHGINDTLEDAERLVSMLCRVQCKVNLIVFNPHAGTRFRPSTPEAVAAFRSLLVQRGMVCTIRDSRGDDEMAACGQLGSVGLAFRPSPILESPERFRPFLLPPPPHAPQGLASTEAGVAA